MRLIDIAAFVGHQFHVARYREAGRLFHWVGDDLRGIVLLDVAGGDGYWAGQARKRGAFAVSLDLNRRKMLRGSRLSHAPALVEGNALRLPFAGGAFDKLVSICAIEHFDDGDLALEEMSRVLKPGGELLLSADALTRGKAWPHLYRAHCKRFHVQATYTHSQLAKLLEKYGLQLVEHTYQFRAKWAERLYLGLSTYGGALGFNTAAVLIPVIAASDRRHPNESGSVVLIRALKGRPSSPAVSSRQTRYADETPRAPE